MTTFTHDPAFRLPGSSAQTYRVLPKWIALVLLICLGWAPTISAQQTALPPCTLTSTPVTTANGFTSLTVTPTASGGGFWLGTGAITNTSLTDNATATVVISGTGTLRVTDGDDVYPAGNYAGFVIGTSGLSVSVLNNITLRTYLGGTLQETASSAALLAISLGSSQIEVGFYTDRPYDAIEIEYASLGVVSTFDVYYAVMRGTGSCTVSATAPCNAPIRPRFDNYRVAVDPTRTSVTGITTTSWTNLDRLVDTDTTNFATLGLPLASVLATANLGIKRVVGTFPAGYFAGFDIENRGLLNVNLLGNVTVSAFRNDTLVGSAAGTTLLLGASLLGNSGRQTIGFVTTESFDEVVLTMSQPVNISIDTTRVYGAVIRNFCAGPTPPCNIAVAQKEATHPVYINTARTGFPGAVCALCRIDSIGNLLDADTMNAASIALTAGVLTTGSISVRNAVTTYPSGTYAGFEISNPTLLDVNVLNNVSVSVYRAGVLKQTFTGNGLLVSLPTSLISATSRYRIGFLADSAFDEVQLNLNQTVAVSLGTTFVYTSVIESFCPGVLACNTTNLLNAPAQSVFIDQRETGVTGAACIGCAVNNPEAAISPSTTDFAQLITTVGVLSTSSLAVKDAVNTYPAGSIAGFGVADPNTVLQLNLLRNITISTYNDGVLQESASAGQLLNLSLLILQINATTGYYNLGLRATRPFDEVKISLTPLAGVAPVLNVYGAYVDTRFVTVISPGIVCAQAPVADPDHIGTPKNMAVTGSLQTNDDDPAGLALTYSTTPAVGPLHGTLTIGANGNFSYTPTTGYVGLDSFAYTVCNTESRCSIGWAFVSVFDSLRANGPNRPQILQPDRSQTIMNVPVSGDAAANDVDIEQRPQTYTVATPPLHGTLSLTVTGQYIYTPDSSYVGSDSALITACDTATPQICRSSILRLMIYPATAGANASPFAADDIVSIRAGLPITDNVLTNDKDPNNDPITAIPLVTVPSSVGTFSMAPNGTWNFNPAPGFIGTINIPYAVTDGQGGSDTATLSITSLPYLGPDYTPTISINGLSFTTAGQVRDFRVDLSELRNSFNDGQLVVRIVKPQAFDIIYSDTISVVSVSGVSVVANANWTFSENSGFVICTLKTNVALPGFSIQSLGFRARLRTGVPFNTAQNVTVSVGNATGGDANSANNQYSTTLTTQ